MTRRSLLVLLAVIAVFGTAGTAHANPSYFATATSTAAATTSPSYMTPGAATTTTPVFDAYAQTVNGGGQYKADLAGLLIQFTASSTATKLTGNVEYSQDGIDWYRNYLFDPTQTATTSTTNTVTTPFTMSWQFASSTVGGAPQTNTNRSTAAMLVPTPFRYIRVVFSITGGNGAVWAQLVPMRQQR